ncbi:hypothetical protein TNCV_278401 [Trichonephila clavipes]|nr:hypothetical protein TNCV_278401 [Trichonephila clavipes]
MNSNSGCDKRQTFALSFLARMEVDDDFQRQIPSGDKANFHLDVVENIWAPLLSQVLGPQVGFYKGEVLDLAILLLETEELEALKSSSEVVDTV